MNGMHEGGCWQFGAGVLPEMCVGSRPSEPSVVHLHCYFDDQRRKGGLIMLDGVDIKVIAEHISARH